MNTEYPNTVDADIKWTTEGDVEMVIIEGADEEIVLDRVEGALAFLDTWSVISPGGSIKTKVFREKTHRPVPQLHELPSSGTQERGGTHPSAPS